MSPRLPVDAADDPDFARPGRRAGGPNRDVAGFYQRLLVNPFLALALLAGGGAALLALDPAWRVGWIFPFLFGWTVFADRLVQYHCLDCGETGPFRGWRRHACRDVVDRWANRRTQHFPTASTQSRAWFVALLCLILHFIGLWADRDRDRTARVRRMRPPVSLAQVRRPTPISAPVPTSAPTRTPTPARVRPVSGPLPPYSSSPTPYLSPSVLPSMPPGRESRPGPR